MNDFEQRLAYGITQASNFAELVKDDASDAGEAFRNTCQWAAITYEKAIAAGIPPLYAANGIVQAINVGLVQVLLDPVSMGDE